MSKDIREIARETLPIVAATLAAAIMGQQRAMFSPESAVDVYHKVAAILSDQMGD